MVYAYGAVLARPRSLPVSGLYGKPVRLLRATRFSVAFTEHDTEPEQDRQRLQEHNRVNLALMDRGPVAPFRFGSLFPHVEALRAALDGRAVELENRLAELGAAVEMTVRFRRRAAPTPSAAAGSPASEPRSGRRYLEAKRAKLEAREAAERELAGLVEDLRLTLGDTLRDLRQRHSAPDDLAIFCLVPRERLPDWRERTAAFFGNLPGWQQTWRAVVSGPWPPSSFV